ncbi:MAG TPA: acetyl-CoA carboxylase, carboxyltransferase subunit beta [Blastocatellia bacterium]|jgi:acetyl-CoA carboxylase carboxyl transferase subunit beta|nr:acetyl-CoA carboxylase, carboxyltransferase subunit beta [Blastocatellia bacterium]
MTWFKKKNRPEKPDPSEERTVRTEGLFVKCAGCEQMLVRREIEDNLSVCPKCGHHARIRAVERLKMTFDDEEWNELDAGLTSTDPLSFVDTKSYRDRLRAMQKSTGLKDALVSGEGKIGGRPAIVCSMELAFVGGSLGAVVGEKITRAIERALQSESALVIFSASGGARMQEGAISLMQMAKISAALARLDDAGLPFISVLTDPTTGGVTASFAMLGDLNIAEPGALIGFAGPRVIEQTIRQKLPEGFQRAEFLLAHGMLDAVVERKNLKEFIVDSLKFMNRNGTS